MQPHRIKIDRSHALAPHLPSAQAEIDASISQVLLDTLTGAQLAEVRRCLDNHWHKARASADREALRNGFVWNSDKDCAYDLLRSKPFHP